MAALLINTRAFAFDKKASLALSHYIMGVVYDDLGDADKAIKEYNKALKIDKESSVIHLNVAATYIKKNDIPKAIEELKIASALAPDAIEPQAILVILYSSQGKDDLSTSAYETALKNASKLSPKNVDIYKSLGIIYLQQGKLKEAESAYKLVLGLEPQDAEANFYLGSIYEELKNRELAKKYVKAALEARPDYYEALNFLGYIYVEENQNLGQAEAMIRKALEFDPDNGAYTDSLGWLYFKKGNLKEALKYLEKASALFEDPVILDHLGDVYYKLRDLEKAKSSWQKSLQLDPKQEQVREKLEKVKSQK